jgi:hypothetical protein
MELYMDYDDDDVYENPNPNQVKSTHTLLFEDEDTHGKTTANNEQPDLVLILNKLSETVI